MDGPGWTTFFVDDPGLNRFESRRDPGGTAPWHSADLDLEGYIARAHQGYVRVEADHHHATARHHDLEHLADGTAPIVWSQGYPPPMRFLDHEDRVQHLDEDQCRILIAIYDFMALAGRPPDKDQLQAIAGADAYDVYQGTYKLREYGLMGWRNGAAWGPYGITRRGALLAERLKRR